MIRKIRQKATSDKVYVAYLHDNGVEPFRTYQRNGKQYYVYDYQDTKIYKIAYEALKR